MRSAHLAARIRELPLIAGILHVHQEVCYFAEHVGITPGRDREVVDERRRSARVVDRRRKDNRDDDESIHVPVASSCTNVQT